MQKQYKEVKEKYPNEIILFRLGDFYEIFHDDAKTASRILNIVLTSRHKGKENETPMCGIPHHALNNYLPKLLNANQRVAICDQVSDPSLPGIVKREVTRVITPGTTIDDNTLDSKDNNYIISLVLQKNIWGLAIADLTTGEFKITEMNDFTLLKNELFRLKFSEVIVPEDLLRNEEYADFIKQLKNVNTYQLNAIHKPYDILLKQFNCKNLNSFGVEKLSCAINAAGRLVAYFKETQKTDLQHITKIQRYNFQDFMCLDEATIRNLELFYLTSTGEYNGSLLSIIDKTITNMGGRKLRQSILLPLIDKEKIQARHQAVAEIKENHTLIKELIEKLKQIADLERLIGRIGCNRTNARELVALKNSLNLVPELKTLLSSCESDLIKKFINDLSDHSELTEYLEKIFVEDPPILITEGRMIQDGYNKELDELRSISRGGKDWIATFQASEVEKTGISSLKVKFNKVFGYYIEISKANLNQVPEDYTRKQTLVNAERFVTPELKEYEEKILGAEEKIFNLEHQIFVESAERVMKYFSEIQKTANIIAQLDMILSFALIANEHHYTCPEIVANGIINIKDGRHPVIEQFTKEMYVPNDLNLDHEKNEFLLLTGPNMSGKSSFLRQTALICLLSQIGSFVPASKADLSVVDRIFTRVGASDNLAQGVSTFMAEMQEAANILNNATKNSLIILDELGRGTSTYDGVSIAWAMIDFIHNKIQAKTLFATHYHELTEIVGKLERAENFCVAVSEQSGKVVFLHKIVKGASSRSYGIEVAKLAGLPDELVEKANQILEKLESKASLNNGQQVEQASLPLKLSSGEKQVSKELAMIDPNVITPIQALEKIVELKDKLAQQGEASRGEEK